MGSVVALVYFIHHVSFTLQAPELVAAVARDLEKAIARTFPVGIGQGTGDAGHPSPDALPEAFDREARAVPAAGDGYLQAVAEDQLMRLARKKDLVLRLHCRPGDFVMRGRPLLMAWPANRVGDAERDRLRSAFFFGAQRTSEQDLEFAMHQMVEIAVRALSTGINDPFTAIQCVDWLAASLARIAATDLPSAARRDAAGVVRVIARAHTYCGLVDAAFNQIRQNSRNRVAVTVRVLEALGELAPQLRSGEQRAAVRRQVELTYAQAREVIPAKADRADVESRYEAAMRALGAA